MKPDRITHPQNSRLLPPGLLVVLCLVVLSRLPFLWTGYGADADAWMVAHAAETIWRTGEYQASRLPGYPLHEMLFAPIVAAGGPSLSNAVTLLCTLFLLTLWYHLAWLLTRFPLLSTLCLAFTPLFWINSATALDYVWSLLCILLSFAALLKARTVISGILLGLAVGFRPTNAAAGVPLLILLLLQKRSGKEIFQFLGAALLTGFVALTPVLVHYGPVQWIRETRLEMSDIHFSSWDRLLFFVYRSAYTIGPLAVGAGAVLLAAHRAAIRNAIEARDPIFLSSAAFIVTYLLLFLGYPLERAYLIPAIPFFLVIVGATANRKEFIILTCCMISFSFVNPDVVVHKAAVGTPGFNVHAGMVFDDWHKRKTLLEDRERIANITLQGKAIVMVGGGAAFWYKNERVVQDSSADWQSIREVVVKQKGNQGVRFVALLSKSELVVVRSLGYQVYCLASAQSYVERVTGMDMATEGVTIIPSFQPGHESR